MLPMEKNMFSCLKTRVRKLWSPTCLLHPWATWHEWWATCEAIPPPNMLNTPDVHNTWCTNGHTRFKMTNVLFWFCEINHIKMHSDFLIISAKYFVGIAQIICLLEKFKSCIWAFMCKNKNYVWMKLPSLAAILAVVAVEKKMLW